MADTPITPVRIPAALRAELEKIAKAETRTISNVVIALLIEALAARDRKESRKMK